MAAALLGLTLLLCGASRSPQPTEWSPVAASAIAGLDPGRVDRVWNERARWSDWGLLSMTSRPAAAPRLWSVRGQGYSFRALVVAGGERLVVLLPHLDGTRRLGEYVARRFGEEGYSVVSVLPPTEALATASGGDGLVDLLRERIRAGRAAVRLAREELEARCLVIMGVSLGGMTAVPVAALEPDVDGVVLMLAGGDLLAAARASTEPTVARAVRTLAPASPDEDGRKRLRADFVEVDPLSWAGLLDPDRVLFARALWDQVVPSFSARSLWQALGEPIEVVYPSGHHSFWIFLPWALDAAIERADAWCSR